MIVHLADAAQLDEWARVVPDAAVTLGSRGFNQESAGLSFGTDRIDGAVRAGHLGTRGFSATNDHVPFGNYNPDVDPFRQDARIGDPLRRHRCRRGYCRRARPGRLVVMARPTRRAPRGRATGRSR